MEFSIDMASFPNTWQTDNNVVKVCVSLWFRFTENLESAMALHRLTRTKTQISLRLKLLLVDFYTKSGDMSDTPTSLASKKNCCVIMTTSN